ncbi:HPP family protein [Lichenihabitans sp. Uapishka_5]|uniref:HPP family protein n=1 Tax=Lichenihabitans sp. Uapishka_5 TaxID=3037302 RepID=UPI0029E7D6F6|nr:HPP family protein [Lichenihabitans sp. Uapishka_5]MDX7949721.1 HPP family protein [Lichenihabitans sp. Uapishka_5]
MRWPAALARLVPDLGEVSAAERLRASVGALLGLLVTGFVSRAAVGPGDSLPLLIAPMGASAVLLFAVPSSPLAQPWSILGGNIVSATVGVTAARLIPDPIAAAAIGGALAIACMMVLRCLHPPSGAVALTAVLGGPAIRVAGYGFVFWPVGINSVLLLAVALVFNNATGRRYPHGWSSRTQAPTTAVVSALRAHDEIVDIGRHDLAVLVSEVQERSRSTPASLDRCADIMRPEPDSLAASSSLEDALDGMAATGRVALPVVSSTGWCIGEVHQSALVRHLRSIRAGRRTAQLFQRSLHQRLAPTTVGTMATPMAVAARPDDPVHVIVDALLRAGADYCPVLDHDGRILGAITQSDCLRWSLTRPKAA